MSNSLTFREIFNRIDEASKNKSQLDEIFTGFGQMAKRTAKNTITPTVGGAAKREVDRLARNLLNSWEEYRGQSGQPNTSLALKSWMQNVLGDNDKEVWANAVIHMPKDYSC